MGGKPLAYRENAQPEVGSAGFDPGPMRAANFIAVAICTAVAVAMLAASAKPSRTNGVSSAALAAAGRQATLKTIDYDGSIYCDSQMSVLESEASLTSDRPLRSVGGQPMLSSRSVMLVRIQSRRRRAAKARSSTSSISCHWGCHFCHGHFGTSCATRSRATRASFKSRSDIIASSWR